MPAKAVAVGDTHLAVDKRRQERLALAAPARRLTGLLRLVHAAPAFTFDRRSNSIRRPLEILDITVPIGTPTI
jgi:hypothetical protein